MPVSMVFTLHCSSEHGAHIWIKLSISIWWRHSIKSKESSIRLFFRKRPIVLHTCATCSDLQSYISTMPVTVTSHLEFVQVETNPAFIMKHPSLDIVYLTTEVIQGSGKCWELCYSQISSSLSTSSRNIWVTRTITFWYQFPFFVWKI